MARRGKRRTHAHRQNGKSRATPELRAQREQAFRVGGAQSDRAECYNDCPGGGLADSASADNPGAALRAAREARGLSIADLTRITKITGTTLLALEHNDLEKLPATIFTRGFVKAYAQEVGLDPETTADRYLAQVESSDTEYMGAHKPALPQRVNRSLREGRLTLATGAEAKPVRNDATARALAAQEERRFGRVIPAAAIIGLIAYVWSFSAGSRPADETSDATSAATDAARTSAEAPTAADATTASTVDADGPFQLELRPQGPCWLSANVDGSPLFSKLLQAGEHQTIEVRDELVMRVGDPGALSFSINGQSGRVLGRAGEPVSVRITKDNFREFLSS